METLITLPYPLSVNHMYERTRFKTKSGKFQRGLKLSERALVYREEARLRINLLGSPTFGQRLLRVVLWLHPPDKRKRDVDNVLKCVLDTLQHCQVYEDDSQIMKLTIEKMVPTPPGCVTIHIHENH